MKSQDQLSTQPGYYGRFINYRYRKDPVPISELADSVINRLKLQRRNRLLKEALLFSLLGNAIFVVNELIALVQS